MKKIIKKRLIGDGKLLPGIWICQLVQVVPLVSNETQEITDRGIVVLALLDIGLERITQ